MSGDVFGHLAQMRMPAFGPSARWPWVLFGRTVRHMEMEIALTAFSMASFLLLILGWVALPHGASVAFQASSEAQPAASAA